MEEGKPAKGWLEALRENRQILYAVNTLLTAVVVLVPCAVRPYLTKLCNFARRPGHTDTHTHTHTEREREREREREYGQHWQRNQAL